MKTLLTTATALLFSLTLFAQNGQTDQGKFVIEANTTLGSLGLLQSGGTNFLLTNSDGTTIWNVGGEVGYFVMDDLAAKVGLGYGDFDGAGYFSWKLGAKYYAAEVIPVQLDFSGQVSDEIFIDGNPAFLSVQGGYAFFFGNQVSLEPSIRYGFSLNDVSENVLQIQTGFSFFF